LGVQKNERWLNVLPIFHVGGASIFARAHVLDLEVIDHSDRKWQPADFLTALHDHRIQWVSVVPTQLHDILLEQVEPPESLRGIIVGGGRVPRSLFDPALDLKWPLHLSYGMTEMASQVATSKRGQKTLHCLLHVDPQLSGEENRLCLRASSQMSGYLHGESEWFLRHLMP